MRVIPLVSLPHTGTHFLRQFLREMIGQEMSLTAYSQWGAGSLPEGATLLWCHYEPETWPLFRALCMGTRAFVPMRDPLAAVVSAGSRGMSADMDRWAMSIEAFRSVNAWFLPVDLLKDYSSRLLGLWSTASLTGVPNYEHCRRWAAEWPVLGASEASELKAAYRQGDLETLERAMPSEVGFLRRESGRFRPWLEKMGYRDLIWWR